MHEYEALYHPGLVHFGIGLVLFGWVVYVFTIFFKRYDASFQKFATWLLLLGGLGTFLALMTVMLFVGHYSGLPREMQDIHMDLAHLTFFSIFITCVIKLVAIVRYKNIVALSWLTFIFYTFSAFLIGLTGYVGGSLAYGELLLIK